MDHIICPILTTKHSLNANIQRIKVLKKYFYISNFCMHDNHGNHQPNNEIIFRFAADLFDDDHKNDQSHNVTTLKIFWNI